MASKNIGRIRILQQHKNLIKQNLDYLHAAPLQSDVYTWHFTFRGPENTDFHQGLYHGQILLPFEYPFKPPDIVFFNKNGRFEVNTKICLTITQYHTQQWNSAWTIRTMLEAVISLFNQKVIGHGYVDASSEVRTYFAKVSHDYTCDKCGNIRQIIKARKPRQSKEQMSIKQEEQNKNQVPQEKLIYKELELKQEIEPKMKKEQKILKSTKNLDRKHKVKNQKQQMTPQQFFLEALKIGSDQYVSVLKSKKFVSS